MTWSDILERAEADATTHNDVHYGEVPCRTVLHSTRSTNLPFRASINPYLNCEIGCAFCFAREFSRRREGQAADGEDRFARRVNAKRGATRILRRELERLAEQGKLHEPIALGAATDPYQPFERRRQLTRRLLEVLLEAARAHPGVLRLILSTRSDLVLRDLDLLGQLRELAQLRVKVSLPSVDRDLLRSLEPRAPTPALRLKAVEGLRRARIDVGVSCSPILPGLTEGPRELRRVFCAVQAAGALFVETEVLSLRGASRAAFMAWAESNAPSYAGLYASLYRGGPLPPWHVRDRIGRVVQVLRQQYGLPASLPWSDEPAPGPRRLPLATPWRGAGPLFEGRSAG